MLDVLAVARLDLFHATDFGGSEHSEEKVYCEGYVSESAVALSI